MKLAVIEGMAPSCVNETTIKEHWKRLLVGYRSFDTKAWFLVTWAATPPIINYSGFCDSYREKIETLVSSIEPSILGRLLPDKDSTQYLTGVSADVPRVYITEHWSKSNDQDRWKVIHVLVPLRAESKDIIAEGD